MAGIGDESAMRLDRAVETSDDAAALDHLEAAAAVRPDTLRTGWPPKGMMVEAHATRRGGPLWSAVLRVLAQTLLF